MKPLILEFAEVPSKYEIDYTKFEYSEQLNLTIVKSNGVPAISNFGLDTKTSRNN